MSISGEVQAAKRIRLDPAAQEANMNTILLTNNEEMVGLTKFVFPDNAGFDGMVKKRYSDFTVREITPTGEILCLNLNKFATSTASDPAVSDKFSEADVTEKKDKAEVKATSTACTEVKALLGENFYSELMAFFSLEANDSIVAQLKELVDTKGKAHRGGIIIPVSIQDKATRTEVHKYIKEKGLGMLDTTTVEGKIQCKFLQKGARNNRRSRQEADSLPFTHFTLYKENRDTMAAVNYIAKILRQDNKIFGFAGTKDKRGITLQRMSAHRITENRLKGLNKGLRGMYLSNFSSEAEGIKLGELQGNRFTVVIREIKENRAHVEKTLATFRQNPSFINYFGMQRFGTTSIPTHAIGLELLKSNWSAAVSLILDPRPGDDAEIDSARRLWKETHDAEKCLPLFPNFLAAERSIIGTLAKDPNNYLEAIKRIPRTLRLMYVHAYQSYIWNMAVSARIATFGLSPVVGDLVGSPVQCLTPENVDDFTLDQVLLPLPGHDVQYPSYLVALYQEIMAKDGLDPLSMSRTEKDFSLTGDYRQVTVIPERLEWEFLNYSNIEADLVQSDLSSQPPSLDSAGSLLALRIGFSLPSSSYATMFLRELMKIRTEKAFMAGNQ